MIATLCIPVLMREVAGMVIGVNQKTTALYENSAVEWQYLFIYLFIYLTVTLQF
jgi:hypothetical protein